jgi:hypothetical protein
MRVLNYSEYLTSADTDILAGSELEFAPGTGVYVIRAASTVNTATLAVQGNRHPVVSSARAIVLRANGEPQAQDQPWTVEVSEGEKVTSALAGTTGTVGFFAQYIGD